MNHKKFLAVLSFLVISGLLFAIVSFFMHKEVSEEPDIIAEDFVTETDIIKEPEDPEIIKDNDDEDNEEEFSDMTVLRGAIAEADESLCHEVEDEKIRIKCFDGVRLAKALELNDLKICDSIEDKSTKEYCNDQLIFKKAINKKEFADCEKIISHSLKSQCLGFADQEILLHAAAPDDCEKILDNNLRTECSSRLKLRGVNLTEDVCSEVENEKMKNSCLEKAKINEALENKDKSLCAEIKDSDAKILCEKQVENKEQLDWAKAAAEEGDAKNCAAIINDTLRQKCEDKANLLAARRYKDITFCDKIKNVDVKQKCLQYKPQIDMYWSSKAKNEEDVELCKNISDKTLKNDCEFNF